MDQFHQPNTTNTSTATTATATTISPHISSPTSLPTVMTAGIPPSFDQILALPRHPHLRDFFLRDDFDSKPTTFCSPTALDAAWCSGVATCLNESPTTSKHFTIMLAPAHTTGCITAGVVVAHNHGRFDNGRFARDDSDGTTFMVLNSPRNSHIDVISIVHDDILRLRRTNVRFRSAFHFRAAVLEKGGLAESTAIIRSMSVMDCRSCLTCQRNIEKSSARTHSSLSFMQSLHSDSRQNVNTIEKFGDSTHTPCSSETLQTLSLSSTPNVFHQNSTSTPCHSIGGAAFLYSNHSSLNSTTHDAIIPYTSDAWNTTSLNRTSTSASSSVPHPFEPGTPTTQFMFPRISPPPNVPPPLQQQETSHAFSFSTNATSSPPLPHQGRILATPIVNSDVSSGGEASLRAQSVFLSQTPVTPPMQRTSTMRRIEKNPLAPPPKASTYVSERDKRLVDRKERNRRSAARSNARRRMARIDLQRNLKEANDRKNELQKRMQDLIEENCELKRRTGTDLVGVNTDKINQEIHNAVNFRDPWSL